MGFNDAFDPDQRLDLRVEPIAHQLKFAVRWDETDGSIVLEPAQSNALMELDVFHLYRFSSRRPSRRFKHHLVVETKP